MTEYFGAPEHLRRTAGFGSRTRIADAKASTSEASSGAPIVRDTISAPDAEIHTDDQLLLRLAEELDYARRMLDSMGSSLTADPTFVMRHSVPLQSIDIVGQVLGHLARVVRSDKPEEAVASIGMRDLKARLQRRSIG